MKTSVVVGLQYGDEGKGLTTSSLVIENDLVVRFNGGHQAGHTVEKNGYRHVFSSFGAGTLDGAHTYWSQYCTFYPKAFYNERKKLVERGYNPVHFIHPLSMITTPFDIEFNRKADKVVCHGSVGVGFGATIQRSEETPFKLFAIDLTNKPLLLHKLNQIAGYYSSKNKESLISEFINYVDLIELNISTLEEIKNNYSNIVFEGAQGIMLDMDFGYFPNVTRSNTTSKNAIQIIRDNKLPEPDIYYVMRSYLTRHGNGYMPNESKEFNFEDKTNVSHEYQGEFRQGYHSLEQLKYALNCDCIFSGDHFRKKHLEITCLSQTNSLILLDNTRVAVEDFVPLFEPKFNRRIYV